jgi:hypothetical protein
VRLATAVLWLLIALAAAGGIRALLSNGTSPAAPKAADEAGGFAEMFVAAYLEAGSGQEQAVQAFYPGPGDLEGVSPGSRYASRTATVGSRPVGPDYWAMTVGAEILVLGQGGYTRDGVHYFRVGVKIGPRGFVATSLPSEVPAPPAGALPGLALPHLGMPGGDAPTDAVRRFFDAYLAGRGDLGSVAAPDSRLAALVPPPFGATALVGIAFGPGGLPGARLVRAEIAGIDAGGSKEILDYSLRIASRRGRWVVKEILPAAPLASGPGPHASK